MPQHDWVGKSLDEKLKHADHVISQALDRAKRPVVLYTGGKDSTVLLWRVRQVGATVPALLIDHGLHFPETWDFLEQLEREWDLTLKVARNQDVLARAGEPGSPIRVTELDRENQREIRDILGYSGAAFPFSLDTEAGNHLLKTVALRQAIRQHGYDHVFVGIRWDEHPARAGERFFSPRETPPHTRVHPILPFNESELWAVMRENDLPTHPLYARGYRSLDSVEARKSSDLPAWEQELGVGERAGREQDKEGVMERLRDLGYM